MSHFTLSEVSMYNSNLEAVSYKQYREKYNLYGYDDSHEYIGLILNSKIRRTRYKVLIYLIEKYQEKHRTVYDISTDSFTIQSLLELKIKYSEYDNGLYTPLYIYLLPFRQISN